MFYLIYNLISIFLVVPVLIYHFYRSASRGRKAAFGERFGYLPESRLACLKGRPVIWLHAVSVGETIAARPLVRSLRERYPDHAIVISCTTETGRGVAEKYPEKDLCIYFPFDFLPAVRSALSSISPEIVIIMETEIWPNFNRETSRRGIPLVLANGRISDRSYKRYLAFSWFFRHPLSFFSHLCMQTDTDCERITAIGAPRERTSRSGNLKYDIPFRFVEIEEKGAMRARYAITAEPVVITAGSTHSGEEELVLDTYSSLLTQYPDLFLVLVPRHPERVAEVAVLLGSRGFDFRRRTEMSSVPGMKLRAGEVLLVDTVGELMTFYALSDIVFVGGSMVATGGHNLLEPASVGVPSLFGTHMANFREVAELVLHYGAGIQVASVTELADACRTLATSADLRRVLGQNGLKLMRDNGGSTERHMTVIAELL